MAWSVLVSRDAVRLGSFGWVYWAGLGIVRQGRVWVGSFGWFSCGWVSQVVARQGSARQLRRVAFRYVKVGIGKARKIKKGVM